MIEYMQIFINIILSYFVGSISGSMVLGQIKGIDIRKMGSGNAGGTNAFRTVGPLFAIGVVVIDIFKGFISVNYLSSLNFISSNTLISHELIQILCGVGAVMGHVYPLFYNFQGGKGAGTLIGIVAALLPFKCLLLAVLAWLVTLILTGFVGLGTIIAGIVLSITSFLYSSKIEFFYFSLSMAIFIIFTHRSNIKRMINGNENQFKKIMLIKKFME